MIMIWSTKYALVWLVMRNEVWIEVIRVFVLHPEEVFLCRKLCESNSCKFGSQQTWADRNLCPMQNFSEDGFQALYQKRK